MARYQVKGYILQINGIFGLGTIWENIDDERMYKYVRPRHILFVFFKNTFHDQINTDQLCQEFSAGKGSGMDENGTLNRGTIPRKAFRLDNLVSVIDSRRFRYK